MILLESSNKASANALAISVLPTPVGPINIKDPIGRESSLIPALCLKIASLTSSIASSCPITLFLSSSFKLTTLSFSPFSILAVGIFVIFETISAIFLSSITSLTI